MNTNDVESFPNAKKMKFEDLLSFSEKESWSVEQSLHNQSKFLRDMQLPLILQCGNLSSKITKVLLRMQQNSEPAKVSIANQDLLLVNMYGEQVITLFENIHGIEINHIKKEKLDQIENLEKTDVILKPGDLLFVPRFFAFETKEKKNNKLMQVAIKLNPFDYKETKEILTKETMIEYRNFLNSQPKTIDCNTENMEQNLNIDWEKFYQDEDMQRIIRVPKISKTIPNDTVLPSGYTMPVLGLGTGWLNEKTYDAVSVALKTGYRLIDTAYSYPDSEVQIGKAIKDSSIPREEVFIVTKLHPRFLGYEQTLAAIDESLQRYISFLITHRNVILSTKKYIIRELRFRFTILPMKNKHLQNF